LFKIIYIYDIYLPFKFILIVPSFFLDNINNNTIKKKFTLLNLFRISEKASGLNDSYAIPFNTLLQPANNYFLIININ